jgi:hypothetical protein
MIFVLAIVMVVTAFVALGRGERAWAAALLVGLIPTMLTWHGFILGLGLVALYLAWVGGTRRAAA